MTEATIELTYVGKKQKKIDTITRSGITWFGFGDSQPVPVVVAKRLLQYPTVWVKTEGFELPEEEKPKSDESLRSSSTDPDDDKTPADRIGSAGLVGVKPKDEPEDQTKEVAAGELDLESIIKSMNPEDPEHFTDKNRPKISAVRSLAGDESITVAQVTEAWNAVNAGN